MASPSGIRTPIGYANLALVRPPSKSAVDRKAEAATERAAEARIKRKVEQAHRVLTRLEERAAAYGQLIKQSQRRKNAAEARAEAVEDRIITEMAQAKLDRLTGSRCTLSTRPAPAAVEVVDEGAIPSEYLREKLVSTPDRVAIKLALSRGEDVPGVRLTQKISLIRK